MAEEEGFGWRERDRGKWPKRRFVCFSLSDVGELINLGICYFGKPKEPNARRSFFNSLSTFFLFVKKERRGAMKEPTSPTAPLASFPPQPEEYRSRAPEFYGFVAWSSTYLLFVLFILWSFLPDEWIVWSGVTWYPNRYFHLIRLSRGVLSEIGVTGRREWALLFPAWSMVLVLLTYFTYFSLALFATPAFSDISTITGTFQFPPRHPYIPPTFNRPARFQGSSPRSSHI